MKHLLGLAVLVAAQSGAQSPAPRPTGSPSPSATSASRDASTASKPSEEKPHLQVVVTLQNGEKVRGLVRAGTTPEKPGGFLGFVNARGDEKTAGIRLWHVFGTNSYLFLPNEIIKNMETVGRLSDLEVKELDKKMEEEAAARKSEVEARLAAIRELQARQGEDRELLARLQDLAKLEEEAAARRAEDDRLRSLLGQFPPDQGWTPDRVLQIRARIVNDVFPSDEEREFVKVYDDWRKAYDLWQEGKLEKPASRPAPEGGTTSRPAPQ